MSILPVYSQKTWPGIGDVDECWILATFSAARASRPNVSLPSIFMFRRWAGDPDDGYRDGGTVNEIYNAARMAWPGLPRKFYAPDWAAFMRELRAGRPASIAVHSARLPWYLRFGFYRPTRSPSATGPGSSTRRTRSPEPARLRNASPSTS